MDNLVEKFEFLDVLRESGVTNMFGAAPFVSREFDLSKDEAKKVLKSWMETFGDGGEDAETRAAKVTGG